MFLRVAAILILTVVSCSGNPVTEFEDCGSTVGEINHIDITPCEYSSRCSIPRGSSVTLALNFTANAEITSAKTSIAGIINDNLYPFPVPLDACQHMECPLQKGSQAFYKNSFFLSAVLPPINATAKFELLDQLERRIVCFTVNVKLAW
ncbi:NPC intracellular cholesterol transporter 2-like [Haliotis rubra]|uniref:NPC intracellular cholesterol transporter 2-like n=1 Tax=Haliotis rubra TaxID=36100 RepID=UPI001EE58980|nr:NPC intracellular cholesterol transporter 2-like [Haliotis rubra]